MIAFLQANYVRAARRDDPDTFMAGDKRQRRLCRPIAVGGMQVGVTDAARNDLDQNLARPRGGNRNFLDAQRLPESVHHAGSHRFRHKNTSIVLVAEHAPTRLATKMAGSHQLLEQRTWPVFRIGELVMEDLHHREQHIEPDHVGQGQRTDRMIATELHSLVDVLGARISLGKHEERFIDHRQDNAIDDEPRRAFDGDGRLAELHRERRRLRHGSHHWSPAHGLSRPAT